MPRPCKLRSIDCNPSIVGFKPWDDGGNAAEKVCLAFDELEAIRLADYEGLYQEQAAERMKVSRQTFGNIIASAHKKVADFLVNSKQLAVEGGAVEIRRCNFICENCGHVWSATKGGEKPSECPKCKGVKFNCMKKIKHGITFNKCWRNI